MNGVQKADVIVIGSGIMGNSAAYYCRKYGLSVIVLESGNIGNGGSSRNGSSVRQSGRDDREIPIALFAAHHVWPTLDEELGVDTEYERVGNLHFCFTEKHIQQTHAFIEGNVRHGLDVRYVDHDECKEICPYVTDSVLGGSFCPTDAHANPMVTTLGFYRAGRRAGVRYITGEKVTRINKIRGVARQVVTARGNIYEGGWIVLCAGHGSVKIAATVGLHLPLHKVPNEIFVTEKYEQMMPYVVCGMGAGVYGTQTKNGSFVFGYGESQTMQLFHSTPLNNPATTHEIISATARAFTDIFPAFADMKVIRSWCGWIDDSMDHVAIIGPVDEVPGLIVACGFSGHGFGIGPGVGYVLAELAAGRPTSVDLSELRCDRFKGLNIYHEY